MADNLLTEDDISWTKSTTLEYLKQYGQTAEQQGAKPKKPPQVSVAIMRGTPIIRYGRVQVGRLTIVDIQQRNVDAIAAMFDLHSALNLPIVFGDLEPETRKSTKDIFFNVARALARGLQEVCRVNLAHPIESSKLATEAYRIATATIDRDLAQQTGAAQVIKPSAGNIVAAASYDYSSRLNNWQRESDTTSPPWPKANGFPIKADGVHIRIVSQAEYAKNNSHLKKLPKEIVLVDLKIQSNADGSKKRVPTLTVRVTPRGHSDWANIKRCLTANSGYSYGAARIVLEDGQWMLKLSITKPRPKPIAASSALVVVPAMNSLAFIVSSDAKVLRGTDPGTNLPRGIDCSAFIAIKEKYDLMRSSRAKHLAFVGPSARGHGKKRLRASLIAVEGQEANFIKTWMEQQASHIARYAKATGAMVFVDDMTAVPSIPDRRIERLLRRFPWCEFRDKILWACEKHGVRARAVRHTGTRNCPMCSEENSIQPAKHNYEFQWCEKCDAENTKHLFRAWRLFRTCLADDPEILGEMNQAFEKSTRTATAWRNKTPEEIDTVVAAAE